MSRCFYYLNKTFGCECNHFLKINLKSDCCFDFKIFNITNKEVYHYSKINLKYYDLIMLLYHFLLYKINYFVASFSYLLTYLNYKSCSLEDFLKICTSERTDLPNFDFLRYFDLSLYSKIYKNEDFKIFSITNWYWDLTSLLFRYIQ